MNCISVFLMVLPFLISAHGSAASLLSGGSSLYNSAEERQANEIRHLKRQLSEAREQVMSLSSQVTTNVSKCRVYAHQTLSIYYLMMSSSVFIVSTIHWIWNRWCILYMFVHIFCASFPISVELLLYSELSVR